MSIVENYPVPMVNDKELSSLDSLVERYEKLTKPSLLAKAGNAVSNVIPEPVKEFGNNISTGITENQIYLQAMEYIGNGFKAVEELFFFFFIDEGIIINSINNINEDINISEIEEICLIRSYYLAQAVNNDKTNSQILAFAEGGGTGLFGFIGLPLNLVLSTLLFFRAVQSIAMHYGYDVKNDSAEMLIAGQVFANSFDPAAASSGTEIGNIVCKVMLMAQTAAVKQASAKGWAAMIAKGSIPRLLAQMRALANKAAQKALMKAGVKGLEKSVFREVFEQIGRKLTLKAINKAVPIAGAAIGAFMDIGQMKQIVEYADIFYQKRFILEKEQRIKRVCNIKVTDKNLSFEYNIKSLGKGETFTLRVKEGSSLLDNEKIIWKSDNENVIFVTDGKMTAKNTGNAVISVTTPDNRYLECSVNVRNAPTKIKLSKDLIKVKVGETFTLNSIIENNEACATRTYRISDPKVVKVNNKYWVGKFSAISPGTAYVTVRTYNGIESSCKIIVSEKKQ